MKQRRHNYSVMARYAVIIVLMLIAGTLIVRKMSFNTVRDAERWNQRVKDDFSKFDTIVPQRGDILADDGTILATNMKFYNIRVDFGSDAFNEKMFSDSLDRLCDSLAIHFPHRTRQEWYSDFDSQLRLKPELRSRTYVLASGASYADYVKVRSLPFFNQKNKYRCGVVLEEYERRVNPYGRMARRSIGLVGVDSRRKHPHGQWGLERSLDSLLFGQYGTARKIPLTKSVKNWTEIPAVRGYDVTTTIDVNLQEMVDNELSEGLKFCAADWGVAVLMDVRTGDIKALSSLERKGDTGEYIEALNRAVRRYEPGSVVKTLSMIIALEDGIVTSPNYTVTTGASWSYDGGKAISDTHITAEKNAREVIAHSSNIGMARIITSRYGKNPGAWYTRLKGLGLFEPMHSGISEELCPYVDSLKSDHGGRIALSRQCYGYATEFSPLWTLAIYNAVANDGRFVRPRLVQRIQGNGIDSVIPVSYIRDRIMTEEHSRWLRDWLVDVIENPRGTAKSLKSDLVQLAGKTGTCYIVEDGTSVYNTSAKRLTFCGFFPAENPVYSCIVLVSRPRQNAFGAASTSGNIFRSIAHKLYARGLLNNTSNYADLANEGTVPMLLATPEQGRNQSLRTLFNIKGTPTSLNPPTASTKRGAVPDVRGYSMRDAIKVLEGAGYNVDFSGAGHVYAQVPEGGTALGLGKTVTVKLTP